MLRRPSSFRSLAAAAASPTAAMSHRPYFRGGRPRGCSGRPVGPTGGAHQHEIISGDSHFRAVREANNRPNYTSVPPPPGQHFYGPGSQPHRAGPQGPPYQQQYRPRPPDYRDWEYAKTRPVGPPPFERFTVLSYNILADYLAIDHYHKLYFHIPHYIMDWNWRRRNICFELGLWSADILCFQEVDRFQDLEAELRHRGYTGIWKMRTGDPADGCAIFWRDSRFKLLHEESIEYNKLGLRDNVAQICVFESLNRQNNSNGASTLSTSGSSPSSNRVVVCNIHVLFNPKRGEVKLGQIRVLLDRAHAVSKLWDDAPIVICGDFNCTPKSPMYNFIAEQKLDLSELPRDKISGQDSAEIRPPKPAYPDFRTQAADNSTEASAVNCEKIEQNDFPLDTQNLAHLQNSTNAPSTVSQIQPGFSMVDDLPRECVELNLQTLSEVPDNQHPVLPENHSNHLTKTSESTLNFNSDRSQLDGSSERLSPNSLDLASTNHTGVTLSISAANDDPCESNSADFVLDEKFECLPLNESVDAPNEVKLGEDCDSFLSELHSSGENSLHSRHDEIINDVRSSSFGPSVWTPAEIQTATGCADYKIVEHPLKLTSSYAEVENSSGLRDSTGEPFITSYHRRFSGTVDYIWHTEGLQTVKILAPIPKHVIQQTRGFPTKKWGSDHIALVSEFAFPKDISSENPRQ